MSLLLLYRPRPATGRAKLVKPSVRPTSKAEPVIVEVSPFKVAVLPRQASVDREFITALWALIHRSESKKVIAKPPNLFFSSGGSRAACTNNIWVSVAAGSAAVSVPAASFYRSYNKELDEQIAIAIAIALKRKANVKVAKANRRNDRGR